MSTCCDRCASAHALQHLIQHLRGQDRLAVDVLKRDEKDMLVVAVTHAHSRQLCPTRGLMFLVIVHLLTPVERQPW